jgi:hypothetical protein
MAHMIRHAVWSVSAVGLTLRDVNVGMRLLDEQVREYRDGRGAGCTMN